MAARDSRILISVSATTRAPRPGEQDGRDYHFVSRSEFERMRDAGEFLEWAEVYGGLYGTPRAQIEEARAAGRLLLLEIDVQGARAVRRAEPDALLIFVEPPTWEVLEQRLERRATEDQNSLALRLKTALKELAAADEFDRLLVNDDLEEAVKELLRVVDTAAPGA